MQKIFGIMIILLMVSIGRLSCAEPYVYDVQPDLTVVGWDRLGSRTRIELSHMLSVWPKALAPWLRVIKIDEALVPQPLASEWCAPNGEVLYAGPCGFNIWSSPEGGENPFPTDAPESVWVNGFIAVLTHEYGHQIGHGTAVEQAWVDELIAEAGDEPTHYLRSMFSPGFFVTYPQEFIASMWNQWGTCSRCTLRLAVLRWDQGNPHPLNQMVLLLALSGFRHGFLNDNNIGTVFAHKMDNDTIAPEFWSVSPWQCGGPVKIQGPAFQITMVLNESCRVTSVIGREGL